MTGDKNSPDPGTYAQHPCGMGSASLDAGLTHGWPRVIEQRRWFAWRPVRTERHGWRWLVPLTRRIWAHRAGEYVFETRSYALLP